MIVYRKIKRLKQKLNFPQLQTLIILKLLDTPQMNQISLNILAFDKN
jgi:hypothetical protein